MCSRHDVGRIPMLESPGSTLRPMNDCRNLVVVGLPQCSYFMDDSEVTVMSDTAVVSEKGQITVPKPLRERLGIRAGSRLSLQITPEGTLSVRVLESGSGSLFGLLARPGEAPRSLREMDAAVTEAVNVRAGGGRRG